MKFLFLRTFAVLIAITSTAALAAPEYVPIQEKAQGRSLTGAHLLNDSIYSNPAASAFTQVYAVEANYLLPKTFGVSILDTRTSDIGGGIGYFRIQKEGKEMLQGGKVVLMHKVSEVLGFGAAGKMLFGPASLGARGKLTDFDAGMLVNLNMLQLGTTVRNVLGGEAMLDQNREVATGARIGYDNALFFSATAVSQKQLKPYQYGFGAEYVSPYYFSVKGGYYFQPGGPQSAWTAGASIISPKLSVHYAVEFPSQPGAKMDHQLGVTMLF